jgi:hypothetical protein
MNAFSHAVLAAHLTIIALATTVPTTARSATIDWQADSKVEVKSHNPQVSSGPTGASGGATLMSVYVGQGGKNLWFSFTDPSFTWQGNQPIKDPKSGNIITSGGGRPALSFVSSGGFFLLVVPGQRLFETWKFPFSSWTKIDSHPDITELQFSEPALGDAGDRTHLLICDSLGNLWWYSMANSGTGGWVNQQRVASGKSPSITSDGSTLHALYWDTDQKAFVKLTLPHGASSWQSHRVFPQGPMPDQGAAIALFNQQLFVVYTAHGNNLQYGVIDSEFNLGPPQQIAPNNRAAATDAPPALIAFQNSSQTPPQKSLVVLHKGQSSDNLWFSVGD